MNWGGSPRVGERKEYLCRNGVSRVNFRKFTQNGPSILASASLVFPISFSIHTLVYDNAKFSRNVLLIASTTSGHFQLVTNLRNSDRAKGGQMIHMLSPNKSKYVHCNRKAFYAVINPKTFRDVIWHRSGQSHFTENLTMYFFRLKRVCSRAIGHNGRCNGP